MKRAKGIVPLLVTMFLFVGSAIAAQSPQVPIAGSAIPQFMQPLPTLSVAPQSSTMQTVFGNTSLTLRMCEFKAAVLPAGAVANYTGTWVWGYLVDPDGTSTCAQLVSMHANPATGLVDTYIGPVIVNQRGGASTDVTWVNDLGNSLTTNVLAFKYSTDQTLHWADPLAAQIDGSVNMCNMMVDMCMFLNPATGLYNQCYPNPGDACAQNYAGPVAAVPHLHGGEQPAEIDGGPDSWFTSDGLYKGTKYYSFAGAAPNAAIYKYPNTQEAAPIWFHDHTLGATRLNVYAGLAGANYIFDPAQNLPANLQPLTEVVPLVLQDRMFDTNGQLFFPGDSAGGVLASLNPEHPYWVPEFVGDTIVINGKAWPFLNVQPKRYRFLVLNGSNARTYEMFLVNPTTKVMGPAMYVIGTDGGYLDAPAKIDPNAAKPAQTKLLIQPGERYEVIIDFSGFPGQTLVLKNTGRTPYPKGAAPTGTTLGQMMQFRVSATPVVDNSYDPASGTPLRTGTQKIVRLADPVAGTIAPGVIVSKTRQLTLNEIALPPANAIDPVTGLMTAYPGGPVEILVNNTKWHGTNRPDFAPISVSGSTTYFSELPREGDTEIWEIVNTTADAHPIHLHAVQFQIMNRQSYNTNTFMAAYGASFPGGIFIPAYGPPLNYDAAQNALSGGKFGGNPDVTPYLQNMAMPPDTAEAGWKDTVIMYPGQVTRVVVRWAPNSLPVNTPVTALNYPFDPSGEGKYNYVWHCHIIDHEDNEMMRPSMIQLNPLAPLPANRPIVKGINY